MELKFIKIEKADALDLATWLSSDSWPFFLEVTPTKEEVLKRIDDGAFFGEGELNFWIIDQQGLRIGLIEIYQLDDLAPMFSIRLRSNMRGKGLGQSILNWLTAFVFENFPDKRRIEGQTREDNITMRKLFSKCGFVKEAYYRMASPTESGDRVASIAYGILREDWLTQKVTPVSWKVDRFFDGDQRMNPENKAQDFYQNLKQRRSIRDFKPDPVNPEIIQWAIQAAGTAPSGANKQPWFFAVIQDQNLKTQIRAAAEEVEKEFYTNKATAGFLQDLKNFKTNESKPYLTTAPVLIGIFQRLSVEPTESSTEKTYYPLESTCIATGLLISALHLAGLGTLTHTPKPMNFLTQLLGLDSSFKPVILLVVGYSADSYQPPEITKKSLQQISRTY